MASIDYFECEDCGFRWKDQGPFQFFINENNEIEEYILLRQFMDLDMESDISGEIVESYCTSCDKKIKIYIISSIRGMDEDEAISILKDAIDNDRISNTYMKQFVRKTDMKDDCFIVDLYRNFYSNKNYNCPSCDSEISRYILAKNKCPKCGGNISSVDGICLDKI